MMPKNRDSAQGRRPGRPAGTHISDLAREAQPPAKGILSRTLYNDDRLKAVLFGFAQGEELSEHTASMPAVLHSLRARRSWRWATTPCRRSPAPGYHESAAPGLAGVVKQCLPP
jgi:hypothetical protein